MNDTSESGGGGDLRQSSSPSKGRGGGGALTLLQSSLVAVVASLMTYAFVTVLGRRAEPAPLLPAVSISNPSVTSDEQNNVEIYSSMDPGVVHITSTVAVQGLFGVFPEQGTGSGSIIDDQGHVLTNYHVVKGARRLDVVLADKSRYSGVFVGADPDNDIAVIKIDVPNNRLRVIPMGDSSKVRVGQKVLAIGNPFGLDGTLTTGVISGLDRPLRAENGQAIEKVIQTDASINPGNSGGPLLDQGGQIIGINTAIYSPTGVSVGIGFAIPINTARKLLPTLISQGMIHRGYLGVVAASLTPALAQGLGIDVNKGLIVIGLQPGGPAASAALTSGQEPIQPGDVILALDGRPVYEPGDLAGAAGEHQPGDQVTLTILRGGRQTDVQAVLGEAPDPMPEHQGGQPPR